MDISASKEHRFDFRGLLEGSDGTTALARIEFQWDPHVGKDLRHLYIQLHGGRRRVGLMTLIAAKWRAPI